MKMYGPADFYNYQERVQRMLGLLGPISVDEIDKVLSKYQSNRGSLVKYPVLEYSDEQISVWRINGIRISDDDVNVRRVIEVIEKTSYLCGYHPAIMLYCLLCNTRLENNKVDILIDEEEMFIRAVPAFITRDLMGRAYAEAKKHIHIKYKSKYPSQRVKELLSFIDDNEGVSWYERLRKWNGKYPQWKYKSRNSMQVVYLRAEKQDTKRSMLIHWAQIFLRKILDNCEQFPYWGY